MCPCPGAGHLEEEEGVGGSRKGGRTKTIAGGVKVQEALNRRAVCRRWFVKLAQPGLMA